VAKDEAESAEMVAFLLPSVIEAPDILATTPFRPKKLGFPLLFTNRAA
jgi:hypothetical protein